MNDKNKNNKIYLLFGCTLLIVILPLIPQFHLPWKLAVASLSSAIPVSIIGYIIYSKRYEYMEIIFWLIILGWQICHFIYCIFYPLCLIILSNQCDPPDIIKYAFLEDYIFLLLLVIIKKINTLGDHYDKLKFILIILFTGPSYEFISNNSSQNIKNDNESKLKIFYFASYFLAPIFAFSIISIGYYKYNMYVDDSYFPIKNNLMDKSFGWAISYLINFGWILNLGRVTYNISTGQMNNNDKNCYLKLFTQFLFALIISLHLSCGTALAMFFNLF